MKTYLLSVILLIISIFSFELNASGFPAFEGGKQWVCKIEKSADLKMVKVTLCGTMLVTPTSDDIDEYEAKLRLSFKKKFVGIEQPGICGKIKNAFYAWTGHLNEDQLAEVDISKSIENFKNSKIDKPTAEDYIVHARHMKKLEEWKNDHMMLSVEQLNDLEKLKKI